MTNSFRTPLGRAAKIEEAPKLTIPELTGAHWTEDRRFVFTNGQRTQDSRTQSLSYAI